MIILLHGPDSYRSRQRLQFYKEGYKKKYDPQGLNVVHLDGEKLTIEDFRKSVGQAGFLAKKRFIVVENLISMNKTKKVQEEVVEYLNNDWTDDNVLIFLEEIAEKTGKKRKTKQSTAKPLLSRLGQEKSEEFNLLIGEQLNKWVRNEIKVRGGQIVEPAVLELASLVGPDLWNMSTEIEKLVNYKDGKTITVDDVKGMVRARFDENIFHLTDALAAKNIKLSLKLLHDQISSGSHELYILKMLTRQFRILLQVREIIDKESNYYTIASRLQLHPFIAQKAIRDARKFTLDELKNIYRQLLDIDIKIKTTQDNPRLLFDLLIAKVCQS